MTYDLTVFLAATAKAGYSRDELSLITNDPNPRAQRVPVPVEAFVAAPVSVHPSPLIMEPVAAGKLETPVTRPLVVISPLPFQITGVESSDPRFRCEFASAPAATLQRLPVVFLGGDSPGKVNARIRIQTTASAAPLEAEVSITLIPPADAEKTAEPQPAESKPEMNMPQTSKPEGTPADPVFGPPAGTRYSGSASKLPSSTSRQDF